MFEHYPHRPDGLAALTGRLSRVLSTVRPQKYRALRANFSAFSTLGTAGSTSVGKAVQKSPVNGS
jgi:hypothetical protein